MTTECCWYIRWTKWSNPSKAHIMKCSIMFICSFCSGSEHPTYLPKIQSSCLLSIGGRLWPGVVPKIAMWRSVVEADCRKKNKISKNKFWLAAEAACYTLSLAKALLLETAIIFVLRGWHHHQQLQWENHFVTIWNLLYACVYHSSRCSRRKYGRTQVMFIANPLQW